MSRWECASSRERRPAWLVLHLSGCWLKAHPFNNCSYLQGGVPVHSSQPPHSYWGASKAAPVPSPSLPRRVPVTRLSHHAKCAAARQAQSRTGSTRGGRGLLMFQEATGRQAQQGLLNDVMLPFLASPLVGLWYVKLHPCGASGNLNTALGSSTIAWLGEAGTALAHRTGCHTHSIPLDRMGLGCRVREDLVMQNHSTLSIIKCLQISFPTKGHQITKNPVRCAGEVDPQMAHGICQWLWS